jgi:hypothetical protein
MSHGIHVGHHSHEGDEAGAHSGRPFDPFELVTALLLGAMAIGASLSTMQAAEWGAKQLDAFAEANTLTTKASTQYNEDTVLMNADYAAVAVAKQHILEARDSKNEVDRERHFDLASYSYESQLSEHAYKAMKLPAGYWEEDAKPEAKDAKEAKEPEAPEPASPEPTLERNIPDTALLASLHVELDEAYNDKMLEKGTEMFAKADERFHQGREANEHRDHFELVEVIYTVGLVFAGLGLVFKTRMRWGMFGIGATIFVLATIRLVILPWAK